MFFSFQMSVSHMQLVLLLSAHAGVLFITASPPTYEGTDPITGKPVQCNQCSPGTFLRSSCSSFKKSECAPCPQGSFTQRWNYINNCLRCKICSPNQVVKKECTAQSDCVCECKQGYYKEEHDICVRHKECPSGQGVLSEGTPEKNTLCHICSNKTYSDVSSAHQKCMPYKSCDAGSQTVLRGSPWHDTICANCTEVKDAGEYLKEIIPAFFAHHSMNIQRLRRIVRKLPSADGINKADISGNELNLSELQARISTWAASATASQIHQLIAVLTQRRANGIAGKLQSKLTHIEKNLAAQCNM